MKLQQNKGVFTIKNNGDAVGSIIKGGDVQVLPVSGTTTVTPEMVALAEQVLETDGDASQSRPQETKK